MIPVVFIHNGNSSYLFNTLYQLKQSNPRVKVYLIGTAETKVYEPYIEHISVHTYVEEANTFANTYKHFSTNSVDFEWMCIQRWFILKAFLKEKGIHRCLYLDSDVLVYEDIQLLAETYKHVGMTLCGISGHTNFISLNTLTDFCSFVINMYQKEDSDHTLETYYQNFIKTHPLGGVSDMTLLTMYAEENPSKVQNTYCTDGSPTIDPSMQVNKYFTETKGGRRELNFNNNKPYGFLKDSHTPVLFYTLHFQGGDVKKWMSDYITNKNYMYHKQNLYFQFLKMLQKIKSKFNV